MYSIVVEWDDDRSTGGRVTPKNCDLELGFARIYYNFTVLPDDIWKDISKEVKQYILCTDK
jgi:hypothetical protein